ncbi:uncharacterized protein [Porites lutea]|uniref:uncharacterized protein n=1 Tax=Porites lutea TaxID=51062 RepID=UPI003CC5A65F
MFFMNAVAYLLLGLPCWKITSAGHNTCRTKRAISEYALKGHVISAIEGSGRTRESCVTACEHFQNCFSINYYSTLKRCELNNKSAEWYKNDLVPTAGALYLTMVSRNYNPCVDRNPPCFGTCVPIPGSLATRCNCQGNATCHNESACSKPLGMQNGSIRDDMLGASSIHSKSNKAWGRLHHSGGSWTPNTDDKNQWFQVNFDPEVKRITHIATQGYGESQWWWVTKYFVQFKRRGASSLETYKENNQRVVG